MHPLLQKEMMRYLDERTNNQYFISTHSAHLLDTPGAAVFHVRLEGGRSVVGPALTDADRSRVCDDLGYHASDLMQANCVIWVEGPSDRVYINHWIKAVDPDLVEGLHYSIMHYGGKLLSRVTTLSQDSLDRQVEDVVSLRRLNQHLAVVIDSDRSSEDQPINDTKSRIASEFEQEPGLAWVTAGREIENYVPADIIDSAIKKAHPSAASVPEITRFSEAPKYQDKQGELRDADKIKVAKAVADMEPCLDCLDLREKMGELVSFIRHANGMS
jgi:predicted ATP-dependent endonuclease of OLD family